MTICPEERARRARVEEERKAIPKTLETVGVAPFGSEADYAGAETLAQQASDNERARRRMKKEMAKVPATEKERLLARQVAGGQLTMEDVPSTVVSTHAPARGATVIIGGEPSSGKFLLTPLREGRRGDHRR